MKREEVKKNLIIDINNEMREALNQWADIMLRADADGWANELSFFPRDIFNVCVIFHHICANVGIKKRLIDEQNAEDMENRFRKLVIDLTGYDLSSEEKKQM